MKYGGDSYLLKADELVKNETSSYQNFVLCYKFNIATVSSQSSELSWIQ